MSRGARWAFLAIALSLYAALGWSLAVFAVGADPEALAWFVLLGLPAFLTAGTAVLIRGTVAEIVWTAILSIALSGLALVGVIVWASSQGAFQ